MTQSLILINPWIYDFAAYDLWSKPLGLLYLAGYLRGCGFKVHLVDCLDVHHPAMARAPAKRPKRRGYGTGKFWRHPVSTPSPLRHVPRPYSRYGLSPQVFEDEVRKIQGAGAVLVTSLMTYWYPGVREAVRRVKALHPDTPVILGGIYARLCHEHALKHSGADKVVMISDPASVLRVLGEYGIHPPDGVPPSTFKPYPAFDLLHGIDYVCLLTSGGCPYRCQYCASHFLNAFFTRRDPKEVLDEIIYWHKDFGVRDFAFYDDALLVSFEDHLGVLLSSLERLHLGIRFHTPNAIHAREVDRQRARLMYRAGFKTIRLGLESADFSCFREWDQKLSKGDFERAVGALLEAGYTSPDIGAYILIGLPGQSVDSVEETIEFVARVGAVPYLSEYSPIPHTALWETARAHSLYDIGAEPLFHNNTLLPCWDDSRKRQLTRLKNRTMALRQRYRLTPEPPPQG